MPHSFTPSLRSRTPASGYALVELPHARGSLRRTRAHDTDDDFEAILSRPTSFTTGVDNSDTTEPCHETSSANPGNISQSSPTPPSEVEPDKAEAEKDTEQHPGQNVSLLEHTGTPQHSLEARIGTYLLWMNICAFFAILASVSVLWFLWFGGDDDKHNDRWRQIMTAGWLDRAVTLSTVVLRLALAFHASTAVSMIASILMESAERGGIAIHQAPGLSIARYSNPGPLLFFPVLWKNARLTRRCLLLAMASVLAVTTLISQLASTLLLSDVETSPIRGFYQAEHRKTGIGMEYYMKGFKTKMASTGDYWTSSPSHATFAEWTNQNKTPSGGHQVLSRRGSLDPDQAFVDTGETIRAFLPIASSSERSMLQEYKGIASAFDARVVCMRPQIDKARIDSEDTIIISGHLQPANLTIELKKVLQSDPRDAGTNFSCVISDLSIRPAAMYKICSLPAAAGGMISQLDPATNSTLSYRRFESDTSAWQASRDEERLSWPVELGHAFLILRSRGNSADIDLGFWFEGQDFTLKENGLWVDLDTGFEIEETISVEDQLSITLCYDALPNPNGDLGRLKHLQEFSIEAKRTSNHSEPLLEWNPKTNSFDTTLVRNQLGTDTGSSISARGIFELEILQFNSTSQLQQWDWAANRSVYVPDTHDRLTQWFVNTSIPIPQFDNTPDKTTQWLLNSTEFTPEDDDGMLAVGNATRFFANVSDLYANETYDFLNPLLWSQLPNNPTNGYDHFEIYAPCDTCEYYAIAVPPEEYHVGTTTLHPALNAIFRDTLEKTDNPALAYQALTTTVLGTVYYEWISTFNVEQPATLTFMIPCQVAVRSTGFAIAMANICVHLLFCVIIVVWFARATIHSLLNNSWQVVAQLHSSRTEGLMNVSTTLSDKEVEKWIKDSDLPEKQELWIRETYDGRVHLS